MTSTTPVAPKHGRRTIRGSVARVLAAGALIGAVACGGDSGTGPANKTTVGLYGLIHVDNKTIPTEIFRGPYYDPDLDYSYMLVLRVTGGEVILQEDGSFHLAVDRTWSAEGEQGEGALTVDGTYRIEGDKIYIETDGGGGSGSFKNGEIGLSLDVGETGTMKRYTFRHAP